MNRCAMIPVLALVISLLPTSWSSRCPANQEYLPAVQYGCPASCDQPIPLCKAAPSVQCWPVPSAHASPRNAFLHDAAANVLQLWFVRTVLRLKTPQRMHDSFVDVVESRVRRVPPATLVRPTDSRCVAPIWISPRNKPVLFRVVTGRFVQPSRAFPFVLFPPAKYPVSNSPLADVLRPDCVRGIPTQRHTMCARKIAQSKLESIGA